jgi:hypothetical protein
MRDEDKEAPVLAHIQRLVADQCWDLLRQRRAAREFGREPSESQVRPAEVVEKYRG